MLFKQSGAQDGMALMETQDEKPVPTSKIHFAYTDGISTDTTRSGPENIM